MLYKNWECRLIMSFLMLALALTSCNSSNDDNNDGGTAVLDDPNNEDPYGYIASLKFSSPDDENRYRCLLDTFAQISAEQKLDEFPAFDFRGTISKTWCSSSVSLQDGKDCMRGLVEMLEKPEGATNKVWAFRESNTTPVKRYGYLSEQTPAATGSAWSLSFERELGGSDDFRAFFTLWPDGERSPNIHHWLVLRKDEQYSLKGYGVDDITATAASNETPQVVLDLLTESPDRFKQITVERFDAVLADFGSRVNQQTQLDEGTRTAAIEAARNDLYAKRDVVNDNAEKLHALLQERVAQESCSR
jgi:hypothetical protein